ncbi:mismatch repair endonuclease PMS2 [Xenentodon cancila]
MIHVLQAYCIISTGVRITCSNQNGQGKRSIVLSTSGSQSMRENIGAIFGPKQLQSLLPFQQTSPSENIIEEYGLTNAELPKQLFSITGFVSRGDHGVGRSATDRQFFFINSRPCDPLKVTKLVNEVYHMYNRHQYPFVALNIAVASECVDVNVTPDKRQVFLQEEKLLLAVLKTSLIAVYEAGVNKISLNYTPTANASSASEQANLSNENKPEPGEDVQAVGPSPRSTMNLAALKSAFSNHNNTNSWNKSSLEKPTKSGPTQKTLQSFFADSVKAACSPSVVSPSKPKREMAKCEPVERSVLDGFRFGKMSCGDTDSEKDNAVSSCDFTTKPDFQHSGQENESNSYFPKAVMNNSNVIKNESVLSTSHSSHLVAEEPALQSEANSSNEDSTVSPEAKRARIEQAHSLTEPKPDTFSNYAEESSSMVDAPVCLQRRTVHLQFSLQELTGNMRRLQQQKERRSEELHYRRFRAKISPGENQTAEDELKKEIKKEMFKEMEIIGQFNLGFIITKLNSDIFMIDQHATDEKYNFEMLKQHTVLQGQKLIVPQKLHLTAVSENVLIENIEIFRKNGFEFLVDEDAHVMERVKLVSLPTSKNWSFGPSDIEELIFMLSDSPGVMCRPSRVSQMFASRACRKSVMIGTALSVGEMKKLVAHMGDIEHPWNCPHGRPTMRHLANLDIISHD